MLCQVVGISQLPQQQPRHPQNGRGCSQQRGGNNDGGIGSGNGGGGGYNNGGGGGGGGYNNGEDGYSGNGSGGNTNGGGYSGNGGGNGSNYKGSYGGGNGGNQAPSGLPPLPVKWYEKWNYCFTHSGDVNNNHTSGTSAHPSENHLRAATHTYTIGGNLRYMSKTVLPSAVGRCPAHQPVPHPCLSTARPPSAYQ
jgi:hypothetical protein